MKNILIILCILISFSSAAQKDLTNAFFALNSAKELSGVDATNKLIKAKEFIDDGYVKHPDHPKMFLYRYQIYLEIAQKSPEIDEKAMLKCIESIIQFLEKGKSEKKVHRRYRTKENTLNDLNVVAGTAFNIAGSNLDKENYNFSLKLYDLIFDLIKYDENDLLKTNNITKESLLKNCYYVSNKMKDVKLKKSYLQQLIDINYNAPYIYSDMSSIYLSENDTIKAIDLINQAKELFPDDESLIRDEINLYITLGKLKDLLSKISESLKNDPENDILLLTRGNIYFDSKDFRNAEKDYQMVLEIDANNFNANYLLGVIYFNKATEAINEANSTSNNNLWSKLKKESNLYYNKALPFMVKAAEIDPKNKENLESLRELYYRLENYKKSDEIKEMLFKLKN